MISASLFDELNHEEDLELIAKFNRDRLEIMATFVPLREEERESNTQKIKELVNEMAVISYRCVGCEKKIAEILHNQYNEIIGRRM